MNKKIKKVCTECESEDIFWLDIEITWNFTTQQFEFDNLDKNYAHCNTCQQGCYVKNEIVELETTK